MKPTREERQKAKSEHWKVRQERSKSTQQTIDVLNNQIGELRNTLKSENSENFSDKKDMLRFVDLPISPLTLLGLERGNYDRLTTIQNEALPLALAGYDVLAAAKTGSGKTLCFAIPVIECLFRERWNEQVGTGALILAPTRELALQIFKVIQIIGYKHTLSVALLTGGRNFESEKIRVSAIGLLIGTPGRILHHLRETPDMRTENIQMLVIDEVDRLWDMGFREALTDILTYLPSECQTLLFSATHTEDVRLFASNKLRSPRYIGFENNCLPKVPSDMNQNFMVLPCHQKLDVLLAILKSHSNDKMIVFAATCNQVRFMYLAFTKILKKSQTPLMCLTSKMRQFRREEVFLTFCRCKSAVLFTTDISARGLDFPLVHWVVHYDCPDSPQTYIHRSGRTARCGNKGVSLLLLTDSEVPMLSYLAHEGLLLREITINPRFLKSTKEIFVSLVVQGLKYDAQKAFNSYLRSILLSSNKHVFDFKSIDYELFANSLGLRVVPNMSELTNFQRGGKNLPWDVVNYISQMERENQISSGKALKTRRERHLEASDLFRQLEYKERFKSDASPPADDILDTDLKNVNTAELGEEDEFFTRRIVSSGSSLNGDASSNKVASISSPDSKATLSYDERISGLSKNKLRRYVNNSDIRIKDLGLSTHKIFEDENSNLSSSVTPSVAAHVLPLSNQQPTPGNKKIKNGDFTKIIKKQLKRERKSDTNRLKKIRRLKEEKLLGKDIGSARHPIGFPSEDDLEDENNSYDRSDSISSEKLHIGELSD